MTAIPDQFSAYRQAAGDERLLFSDRQAPTG